MVRGKRLYEWEQTAKLCQAVIWPHLTEEARRRAGRFDILPADIRGESKKSSGMSKAEIRAMRGVFKNVVTLKAADVRIRRED